MTYNVSEGITYGYLVCRYLVNKRCIATIL